MRSKTSTPINAATNNGCGLSLSARMMACGLNAARQAASSGLMEKSTRLLDGLFDHISWHVERSRKHGDKFGTAFEIAAVELLKSSQAL